MANKQVTIDKNDFEKIRQRVRAAAAAGVRLATEDLGNESVTLAPVLTGALRGSKRTAYSEDGLIGEVSFNELYAAAQHEKTDQAHPGGGQAKYLEAPLVNNMARYRTLIAEQIKKALT